MDKAPVPATPSPFRTIITVTQVSRLSQYVSEEVRDFDTQEERNSYLQHVLDSHMDEEASDRVAFEQDNGYYGYVAMIVNPLGGMQTMVSAFPSSEAVRGVTQMDITPRAEAQAAD